MAYINQLAALHSTAQHISGVKHEPTFMNGACNSHTWATALSGLCVAVAIMRKRDLRVKGHHQSFQVISAV